MDTLLSVAANRLDLSFLVLSNIKADQVTVVLISNASHHTDSNCTIVDGDRSPLKIQLSWHIIY